MKKIYYAPEKETLIKTDQGNDDLLNEMFELLRKRGFAIQTDQEILERYPVLAENRWEGKKGDLLFKAENHPSGFEIEFYQEINTENRNGGKYDFNKLEKMPYLVKLEFFINRKLICQLLEQNGLSNRADSEFKYAMDEVMHRIKSCWHYKEGKELPEYEFESYNAKDRDDKQLHNGDVKYYRDRKGCLMRGKIFHHINNMWWVILNDRSFTNEASFRFFDLITEEDHIPKVYSREMPHRIRAEKLRNEFNEKFNYKMLKEEHIQYLRNLVNKKLFHHDDEQMNLRLKEPLKKDLVVLKRTGLRRAEIKVKGSYFSDREGITFNEGGWIGFAGWASGYSLKPFVDAFEEWLEWLELREDE